MPKYTRSPHFSGTNCYYMTRENNSLTLLWPLSIRRG